MAQFIPNPPATMEIKSPPVSRPFSDAQFKAPQFSSPIPSTPLLKPGIPSTTATTSTPAATPRPPLPSPAPESDVVHVPSYARWFSWENIDDCEIRALPEIFDSNSPIKNPNFYKYVRNSIIKQFRENPARKITFTEVRKTLVGDVGSIRRVFDFLELWGLINYSSSGTNKPLRWEDGKESKSSGDTALVDSSSQAKEPTRRYCSGCKSVCTIACFACDKYDLTLCARCYVRGNYRVGVSNADFRRVEISEEIKTDWTDRDTLQLLEAVMHYGDDWKRVAQHVGGRTEKDCITHFIRLPFGEEFTGYPDSNDAECEPESNKRMRLTPLADASNPIMAQAAFLSALVGEEVAEAAARAAVSTLSEVEKKATEENQESSKQGMFTASNDEPNQNQAEKPDENANSLLEKQEEDMERKISETILSQMKEMQEKIRCFEEFDLQMEKEWRQIERMKSLLSADHISLLFHKNSASRSKEKEIVTIDVSQ